MTTDPAAAEFFAPGDGWTEFQCSKRINPGHMKGILAMRANLSPIQQEEAADVLLVWSQRLASATIYARFLHVQRLLPALGGKSFLDATHPHFLAVYEAKNHAPTNGRSKQPHVWGPIPDDSLPFYERTYRSFLTTLHDERGLDTEKTVIDALVSIKDVNRTSVPSRTLRKQANSHSDIRALIIGAQKMRWRPLRRQRNLLLLSACQETSYRSKTWENLTWGDLTPQGSEFEIHPKIGVNTKVDGKHQTHHLGTIIRAWKQTLKEIDPALVAKTAYLLPDIRDKKSSEIVTGKRIPSGSPAAIVAAAARKVGIHATLHGIRRGQTVHRSVQGQSDSLIRGQNGHGKNAAMNVRYTGSMASEHVIAAIKRIMPKPDNDKAYCSKCGRAHNASTYNCRTCQRPLRLTPGLNSNEARAADSLTELALGPHGLDVA